MDKEQQLLSELNKILFYEQGPLSLYEGHRKIVEDENIFKRDCCLPGTTLVSIPYRQAKNAA